MGNSRALGDSTLYECSISKRDITSVVWSRTVNPNLGIANMSIKMRCTGDCTLQPGQVEERSTEAENSASPISQAKDKLGSKRHTTLQRALGMEEQIFPVLKMMFGSSLGPNLWCLKWNGVCCPSCDFDWDRDLVKLTADEMDEIEAFVTAKIGGKKHRYALLYYTPNDPFERQCRFEIS